MRFVNEPDGLLPEVSINDEIGNIGNTDIRFENGEGDVGDNDSSDDEDEVGEVYEQEKNDSETRYEEYSYQEREYMNSSVQFTNRVNLSNRVQNDITRAELKVAKKSNNIGRDDRATSEQVLDPRTSNPNIELLISIQSFQIHSCYIIS